MLRALTRSVEVRHCFRAYSSRNPDQQMCDMKRACAITFTTTSLKKLTRFSSKKHIKFNHLNVIGCYYPHSSQLEMSEVWPQKLMGIGESIHRNLSEAGCTTSQHNFTEETATGTSHQDRNASVVKYVIALLFLCTSGICSIWPHIKDLLEGSENWHVFKVPSSLVHILLQSFTVNAAKPLIDDYEKPNIIDQGAKNKNDMGMSRRQRFNFIADVLESVESAVVCIEVKDHTTTSWFGMPQASSNGSGFIVKEDGLILTNAHVVASQQRNSITVKLHDGRCFAGFIEDVDYESDLATVRVKARGLPTLQLGCSSDTRIGEWVVAVGSPLNLSNTVTAGVVSCKRGAIELGIENDINYIQTDAAITFGNSGGPLINLDGEAIGINSMKVTPGISFAIPIDHAKKFLQRAEMRRATGKTKASRRYMGLTILTLTDQIRKELEMRSGSSVPSHGVFVWQIVRGGPAFLSGLQPGDVITHINGQKIISSVQVHEIIKTDDELVVEVQRWGRKHTFTIVPENIIMQ